MTLLPLYRSYIETMNCDFISVIFADISEGYWWYDQEVITNLPIALEMSLLRQRRKPVAQIVTELDAFPKVPETYVEQTATGAYGKIKFHYCQAQSKPQLRLDFDSFILTFHPSTHPPTRISLFWLQLENNEKCPKLPEMARK